MHSLRSRGNQSGHVLPEVLLDSSRRRNSAGNARKAQDDLAPGNQVEKRLPPPYRPPPPGLLKDGTTQRNSYSNQENRHPPAKPNYMPPPPPVAKEPPPYRKAQDFPPGYPDTRAGYADLAPPSRSSELPYHPSDNLSKNTLSASLPSYPPPPSDATPIAPPRKHRMSASSDEPAYLPTELSPAASPRKHQSSIPEAVAYPPKDTSPSVPLQKHRASIPDSSEDYPYPEISPTAPPRRKHRRSVSSEDPPPRPSHPPPSVPLNVTPPRTGGGEEYTYEQTSRSNYPSHSQASNFPPPRPNMQGGEDYTLDSTRHEVPPVEPDDTEVIPARRYTDYNTESSYYQGSEPNNYYPPTQSNFERQSSNYRRSDPYDYNRPQYGNFKQQSSNYRRSEGNEYNISESSYPQSSSLQYPPDSGRNYSSEFSPNIEPTPARDHLDGHESRPIRPRSAVDITTRDHSPPDEIVVARSVTSEPERYSNYPDEFRTDRRETTDYIPMRTMPEMNRGGYNGDGWDDSLAQPSYENEFDTVTRPKYEGYTETNSVLLPKYEGYEKSDISRPEPSISDHEPNFVEPEFIVAKQMTSHEAVPDGRLVARNSREDMDFLPGALQQDMKHKWVSNTSDGSSDSNDSRNKYRMTSMI